MSDVTRIEIDRESWGWVVTARGKVGTMSVSVENSITDCGLRFGRSTSHLPPIQAACAVARDAFRMGGGQFEIAAAEALADLIRDTGIHKETT